MSANDAKSQAESGQPEGDKPQLATPPPAVPLPIAIGARLREMHLMSSMADQLRSSEALRSQLRATADFERQLQAMMATRNQLAHSSIYDAFIHAAGSRPARPSEQEQQLRKRIGDLQSELAKQQHKLEAAEKRAGDTAASLGKVGETLESLREAQRLAFVTSRVSDHARDALFASAALKQRFERGGDCHAFVLAADIRRSTDLMLKARSPQLYAEFISDLCIALRQVITDSHGVFDKFTGDGVLAFFPDFFSGPDAGYMAVQAAEHCHNIFERLYSLRRTCFQTVLKDVGLGIGVDFGEVRLLQIADSLTVVGTPVVYACRMSGAPPATTLLNQPAYELLLGNYSAFLTFDETEYDAKHEGLHVAYRVRRSAKEYNPRPPAWQTPESPAQAGDGAA